MKTQNKPRGRGRGSADIAFTLPSASGRGRGWQGPEIGQRQATPTSSTTSAQLRGRGRGGDGTFRGRGGSRGSGRGAVGGAGHHLGPLIYREDIPARLPPQLQPAVLQQLVDDFAVLDVRSPKRPLCPGYGTLGTEINLRTNYFPMDLPNQPIFSYNVTIVPKADTTKTARIFQLLEQNSSVSHPIAHDRSQRLVSPKMLPQPLNVAVPFYDDHETGPGPYAKTYHVSITFDREFDPNELTRCIPFVVSQAPADITS